MKSVLISIRPKWCELIANGKKTIEVRKTRPKLKAPFTCYIYCTKEEELNLAIENRTAVVRGDGKIIGEFTCNSISEHWLPYPAYQGELDEKLCEAACVDYWMLHRYVWSGGKFYGWHISGLTIYDRPRGLWEFQREETSGAWSRFVPLTRPPQSWCYVEEVTDG